MSGAGLAREAPVLDTVEVGPPVAGPRDALRAVGFYAANAAALPRPAALDRALYGVGQVLHAARLVASDRALRRAALVPTILTVGGCAAIAAVATAAKAASGEVSSPAATFHVFLVSFVALASMPPTLLQRMWLRVAHGARRALGLADGDDALAARPYLRLVAGESMKALRQAIVVSIGIAPLVVAVRGLPFGDAEAAALAAAWTFHWIAIDAFELPLEVVPGPRRGGPEPWFTRLLGRAGRPVALRPLAWLARFLRRLTRPWHEEIAFTERHAWEVAGFGVAVGAVLAVPVVGLFFRSIAIVAATALQGRLAERRYGGARSS